MLRIASGEFFIRRWVHRDRPVAAIAAEVVVAFCDT
jgi:hypothetical protein